MPILITIILHVFITIAIVFIDALTIVLVDIIILGRNAIILIEQPHVNVMWDIEDIANILKGKYS